MLLKLFQYFYWDIWIFVYSWFNSCFMFITKGKPHFSLISSFYCCLVKEGWALKVALQFVMQGIVAYKPLAYQPTPTPPSKPLCQAIYLLPGQTNSPHLHQHIDKHLLNFIFCESQTNNVCGFGTGRSWGLTFSGIGYFGISCGWRKGGQNLGYGCQHPEILDDLTWNYLIIIIIIIIFM